MPTDIVTHIEEAPEALSEALLERFTKGVRTGEWRVVALGTGRTLMELVSGIDTNRLVVLVASTASQVKTHEV